MKEWTVWIKDVGAAVVAADDIDGAYLAAAKQYGCSTGNISAVFWQANNFFGADADTSDKPGVDVNKQTGKN